MPRKIITFRNQDYHRLKKQYTHSRQLFIDPEFPPHEVSLFYGQQPQGDIEWRRPGEIDPNPRFSVDGFNSSDVMQGVLGNCWFVAACSALTHHKALLERVIPGAEEQEWDTDHPERYCGLFHFAFWQFGGHWVDVVIDDLLPTQQGKLVFARSKTTNEFWSALLEKAFAKLHGCYEALIGGNLAEALVDISGGVPETIDLRANPELVAGSEARAQLFGVLETCFEQQALMATAIAARTQDEVEQHLENGLVKGHSYTITDVRRIALDGRLRTLLDRLFRTADKVMMVRLRNPWGEIEWNGPWSDQSAEWTLITERQKNELGIKIDEDGEFWMAFDDFCDNFTDISICHQLNTSFFSLKTRHLESIHMSAWRSDFRKGHRSNRAGGCANFKETFLQNPQYSFDIPCGSAASDILVSLMQNDIRTHKQHGVRYPTIGMHVMKIENNRSVRLHRIHPTVATSEYVNTRSVFMRLRDLKPGRYSLLPTTYGPGDEAKFMLRIYSEFDLDVQEVTSDLCTSLTYTRPLGERLSMVQRVTNTLQSWVHRPKGFTHLTVLDAPGLILQDEMNNDDLDSYCVVRCEGTKCTSPIERATTEPKYDFGVLLLRRSPGKAIHIDLYSANLLKDAFLGRVTLDAPVTAEPQTLTLPLCDKRQCTGDKYTGRGSLRVFCATYDDPTFV